MTPLQNVLCSAPLGHFHHLSAISAREGGAQTDQWEEQSFVQNQESTAGQAAASVASLQCTVSVFVQRGRRERGRHELHKKKSESAPSDQSCFQTDVRRSCWSKLICLSTTYHRFHWTEHWRVRMVEQSCNCQPSMTWLRESSRQRGQKVAATCWACRRFDWLVCRNTGDLTHKGKERDQQPASQKNRQSDRQTGSELDSSTDSQPVSQWWRSFWLRLS